MTAKKQQQHYSKKNKKKGKKDVDEKLIELSVLNRFAGSSDEEDGDDGPGRGPTARSSRSSPPSREDIKRRNDQKASSKSTISRRGDESDGSNDEIPSINDASASELDSEPGKRGDSNVDNGGDKTVNSNKNDSIKSAKEQLAGEDDDSFFADNNDQNSSEDLDDDGEEKATGMASAMAKILGRGGGCTKNSSQKTKLPPSGKADGVAVVLSRTKTPLQKQLEKEKANEKQQKEKRKVNKLGREPEAYHVPLNPTVPASAVVRTGGGATESNKVSASEELEKERLNRRIATRGVVALFNAIARHQHGEPGSSGVRVTAAADISSSGKPSSVSKMTKRGFLDMIKSRAAGGGSGTGNKRRNIEERIGGGNDDDNYDDSFGGGGGDGSQGRNNDRKQKQGGWTALRDDYMLTAGGAGEDSGLDDEGVAVEK